MGDPYTYEGLREENERLKEEVMKLRNELELLRGGEEPEEGEERKILYVRSRKKGTGASYDVIRLNRQHRRVLYALLTQGAISTETSIPAIQIRRLCKASQAALSGRVAELIRKGYIVSSQIKVLFQPDAEGSWQYRPEAAYDPNISARRRKRFTYYITDEGKRKLIETATPTDDFIKADLDSLIELKRAIEAKGESGG